MKKIITATLLASAAMMAAPAEAAQYLITYSGVVSNGIDMVGGVFNSSPAERLTGLRFVARYTLTVPTPGSVTLNSPGNSSIFGGGFYTGVAPVTPLTATLTINGVTQSFGQIYGYSGFVLQRDNDFGRDTLRHDVSDYFDDGTIRVSRTLNFLVDTFVNNIVNTTDFTAPLVYHPQLGDNATGNFDFQEYLNSYSIHSSQAAGSLVPDLVTIEALGGTPGVPEPASWGLMIAGFGLVGGAMRRRVARVSFG